MTASFRTESERWFAAYLDARGLAWDYEPDLGRGKRPDFLITTASQQILADVKEFTPDSCLTKRVPLTEVGGAWGLIADGEAIHAAVRSQIREAARQLRPYRDSNIALMVVLANPQRIWVGDRPDEIVEAMYGDLQVAYHVDEPESARMQLGRNGKLRNDHRYLSAVGLLREDSSGLDSDDSYYLDTFLTRGEEAVKLQQDSFAGLRDSLWGFLDDEQYGPLRGPAAA